MLRIATTCFSLVLAGMLALPAFAQERGEEVVGSITSVDGQTLIISRENRPEVRVQVTPSTRVEFTDSGDRKLFPNPAVGDLRAGMGVRFVFGTGTLDHIRVHFVPERTSGAGSTVAAPVPSTVAPGQVKARIQSVTRGGRDITADVAGRTEHFRVEGRDGLRVEKGDLVVLTVEDRAGARVVTRIDPAELYGRVTRLDSRARTVSIDVDGREESYRVENRDLLDGLSVGSMVSFETEERSGGSRVVTTLRRDRR
jgi:hypothetical protein